MFITIGNKTKKFMKILELHQYPFSVAELNSSYKRLIKIHHPDKGGDENTAKQIIIAYEALKNLAISETTIEKCQRLARKYDEEIAKDMFILFNNCEYCNGTGNERYTVGKGKHQSFKFRRCLKCYGTGKIPMNPFNPVIPKGAIL